MEFKTSESRWAQYALQVSIRGTRKRVWRALTDQLGAWWLPDFHIFGPDSLVTLEPRAGGRLFETHGERELLWYTVVAIEPEQSLSLVGYSTPEFGGPYMTMLTARLHSSGDDTEVRITDSLIGRLTDESLRSLCQGWTQLFTDGLKRFVERNAG